MELSHYSNEIKTPTNSSRLWKDECCYSFDTPKIQIPTKKPTPTTTSSNSNTNNSLNISGDETMTSPPPPKKLAIGVEGGFNPDEEEIKYEDHYSLYLYPSDQYFSLTDPHIPKNILDCVEAIKVMNSQSRKEEIVSWSAENVLPSAFAESLVQIENGVKVAKSGWRCDVPGCDKTENLWLNLTDGFIGCGRKYSDGSGGNGHAKMHFEDTQFPITVKLGTITKEGKADVYSYPEDDMVMDPLLKKHLAHFGIDIGVMSKTEKSMAELELDQNLNYEFGKIQEKGKDLENVFGPGLTGIENLGNSCYMSSVLQMLFSLDSFKNRFLNNRDKSFQEITQDPTLSVEIQFSKLAHGLLSGDYSIPAPSNNPVNKDEFDKASQIGIAPKMFKSLIGGSHPLFSTMQQQDALEYFQYVLEAISRHERHRPSWIKDDDPTKVFSFQIQDRIECGTSHKVKYTKRFENVLSLPVPLEASTNKDEVAAYEASLQATGGVKPKDAEEIRPIIPLQACLNSFIESFKVDDFYSSAIKNKTFSINSTKLASFPDVLVIHLRKYTFNPDMTPKKLNVFMDVPDTIDIEHLRGHGKSESEELLPEDDDTPVEEEPKFNQDILDLLTSMDFPLIRCKKALLATGGNSSETAINWIFEHSEDPDIDAPIPTKPTTKSTSSAPTFKQEDIGMIEAIGFSQNHAKLALQSTNGNLERAVDWLYSHTVEELDALANSNSTSTHSQQQSQSTQKPNDGPGKYKLLGFITHIGNNVQHGHYVCHIIKNGKWIKFNDRHVQLSQEPPKEMGYIYFYQRKDFIIF
eukprot:gene4690-5858_t